MYSQVELKIPFNWFEQHRLSAMLGKQAFEMIEGNTFFYAEVQSCDGSVQLFYILYASLQKKLNSKKKPAQNKKGKMPSVQISLTLPEMSVLLELLTNMNSEKLYYFLIDTHEALHKALLPYQKTKHLLLI